MRREKAYLKKNPTDKPYFGDGLPFQPIDEVCTTTRRTIHKALAFGSEAKIVNKSSIKAIFAFPKPCKDPDRTTYTIKLVRIGAAWLIDNVYYDGNSNLAADLRRKEY